MTMRFLWLFLVLIPNVVLGKGVKQENYLCKIRGDPHLKTFSGQSAPLPWPCVYPVTKLDFNKNGDTIHIEVFATSDKVRYRGKYYVSFVQVTVKDTGSESEASYTVDARTAAVKGSAFVSWVKEGDPTGLIDEYIITISTSQGSQFAFLVGDVQLLIFRPVNKGEKANHQSVTPGLFVKVPKNGPLYFADAAFPATVCSTPEDRLDFSLVNEEEGPLKRKEQVMIFYGLMYENTPETSSVCNVTMTRFRNCFHAKNMTAEVAQEKLLTNTVLLTMTEEQQDCLKETADLHIMRAFRSLVEFGICHDGNTNDTQQYNAAMTTCRIDALITTGPSEQTQMIY